jgi:putative membrane protein
MKQFRYQVAGAALLLAALGGCDTMNALLDDKPGNAFAETEAMPPQEQDATFVQTAAKDGAKEVALGELAVEKAASPAVKAFAERMVSDHGATNTELRTLADSRDLEVPAMPPEGQDPATTEMETLSGKAFDEAYVELMVAEHEKAVALFEAQASAGSDPALVAFAEEKLPTLRQHLAHAQGLQDGL